MKFLTLLLLCCVAKNINSATAPIRLGTLLDSIQNRMNGLLAATQKQVVAAGGTNVKVPTAPKVPTPANPNIIIKNPPRVPLPNEQCDFKGLSALLKAMFGRVKGSCSNVKKSKGPLARQCQAAKSNFTMEFNLMYEVTKQISFEFPTCSEKVNPTVQGLVANVGKVFDVLITTSTATDTKKCGKEISVAVKELTILLKALFENMNSVTGSAKPAAGSNAANAVATSEVFLSSILLNMETFLDLVISASTESSVETSDLTKTLSAAVKALNKKVAGGSKLLGSQCIEFSASLTVIIKSESSVDLGAITEEFGSIESDLDELTNLASDIEVDDGESSEESSGESSGENSTPGEETTTPGEETTTPGEEKTTPGEETTAPGEATAAPGEVTTAPGEVTTAPGEATTASGEVTTAPGEATTASGEETPAEKPSPMEILIKFSLTIKVSIQTITKSCGPLKTDVPGMGGQLDASLSSVGTSLSDLLSLVQTSDASNVLQLGAQIDIAIAAFVKALTDFLSLMTKLIDSLANDKSVAAKDSVSALELIRKTIVSVGFKVMTSISVFFEKFNLFQTMTLDAIVTAIGKIDVSSADFKTVTTDLKKITSEVNVESGKKVAEGLGKCVTEAVGKIKSDDKGKFELRISSIFSAFCYTFQNLKEMKVSAGVLALKSSVSVLIKETTKALSCAEASKAEPKEKSAEEGAAEGKDAAEGEDVAEGEDPAEGEDATEGENAADGEGAAKEEGSESSEEESADKDSGDKKIECEPISPDAVKLVFSAILSITEASKAIATDKTLNPETVELFNLVLKTLLTALTEVLNGLSKKLTEQSIDFSIMLKLGLEILTESTAETEIDCETLTTSVDGVMCYGQVVDAATPALNGIQEIEDEISASDPAVGDTEAILSELATSSSFALTIFSKSLTTLKKYFTKLVDRVSKALTKIGSDITAFINKITSTAEAGPVLQGFLLQISLSIVELTTAYTECADSNTELEAKGYNAKTVLTYLIKSALKIIKSIFVGFKVWLVDIPADCTELHTQVWDAISADVSSPEADPSEVGGKLKEVCDKHNESKDKSGSGEGGSGEDGKGEGGSGETGSGEAGSGEGGSGEDGKGEGGSGETGSGEAGSGEDTANTTSEDSANTTGEDTANATG